MGGNDYTILLVAALTVVAAFIIWVFVMTIFSFSIVSSVIAFLLQMTAAVFTNEPTRKLREKRKKKKSQEWQEANREEFIAHLKKVQAEASKRLP